MQRVEMTEETLVITHPVLGEMFVIDCKSYFSKTVEGVDYEIEIYDSFNESESVYINTIPDY